MDVISPQKIWDVKRPDPQLQLLLCRALDIHPIVAQLCVNRGLRTVEEARQFLTADLPCLHDPFLLKDMDKAVARIRLACERKEKVLIFGDYDVDGVTSSALLHNTLKRLGLEVVNHIPHRAQDGYGLNDGVGKIAQEAGARLLITVDCGITACREVEMVNALGIDVIILDHHEPLNGQIPSAAAVVNPKRPDCPYPFKSLAAVGLVGKLSQALSGQLRDDDLDLIALGTIADVVPLRGENRVFVKEGLPRIGRTKNKGLAALIDIAKLKGKEFKPYFVGFILGPRINATGRMDSATKSLELLLCDNHGEAYVLAQFLEEQNTQRQKLQKDVVQQAMGIIEREINFSKDRVIVLSQEGWHKGVLGIVASRIADTYYRPTIVISLEGGVGTASARSIEGFHLHEALNHCSPLLETFGGHKLAAGLTIKQDNIARFRELINEFAARSLSPDKMTPSMAIDCEIPLNALTLNLVKKIEALQPYGEGNPLPVFCSRKVMVKHQPQVLGKDTLKFPVTDGKVSVSVVGFGMAKYRPMVVPGQYLDLVYEVGIDDWNKDPVVQLKLKDIRECPTGHG